jgi:putative acetyltransferase
MAAAVPIRPFRPGDEAALRAVYFSAIHEVARRDYSQAQLDAWAPAGFDAALWARRIQGIAPFVALGADGVPIGYADIQPDGYIDHFFVAGHAGGQGVGGALMRRLLDRARQLGVAALSSDVSRTAQPFFARFGFEVVEQRRPVVRGVEIPNALMRRWLAPHERGTPPASAPERSRAARVGRRGVIAQGRDAGCTIAVDAGADGAGYVVRVDGGAPAELAVADRQVLARLFVEADWVVDWA